MEEEIEQLARAIAESLRVSDTPAASGAAASSSVGSAEPAPEPEAEGWVYVADAEPAASSSAAAASAAPAAAPPAVVPTAAAPVAVPLPEPWEPRVEPLSIGLHDGARGEGFRYYAVWSLSSVGEGKRWAGVHVGEGSRAYRGLLTLNGGHFGGLRFRRNDTLEQVVAAFWAEAPRWKLSKLNVWFWGA